MYVLNHAGEGDQEIILYSHQGQSDGLIKFPLRGMRICGLKWSVGCELRRITVLLEHAVADKWPIGV